MGGFSGVALKLVVHHDARRRSRSEKRPHNLDRHVHGGHVERLVGRGRRRSNELSSGAGAV